MSARGIEKGPMLAVEAPTTLTFPLYFSPKLDGIRAAVKDGLAMSRSMKMLPNLYLQEFYGPHMDGLDGEIIVGDPTAKDVYRRTSSGCMSEEGSPDFKFYVFDYYNDPDPKRPYEERLERLRAGIEMLNHPRVELLPQTLVHDMDQLVSCEEAALERGYEGGMLRSPKGVYKFGRSTAREGYLLKMKRFVDGEAIITGVQEYMHNANEAFTGELGQTKRSSHKENLVPMGTLGALLVKDCKTGVEFAIGTGYTNADRDFLWSIKDALIGKITKYKSFEIGVKDKPRFPVWLGLRSTLDMPVGFASQQVR